MSKSVVFGLTDSRVTRVDQVVFHSICCFSVTRVFQDGTTVYHWVPMCATEKDGSQVSLGWKLFQAIKKISVENPNEKPRIHAGGAVKPEEGVTYTTKRLWSKPKKGAKVNPARCGIKGRKK